MVMRSPCCSTGKTPRQRSKVLDDSRLKELCSAPTGGARQLGQLHCRHSGRHIVRRQLAPFLGGSSRSGGCNFTELHLIQGQSPSTDLILPLSGSAKKALFILPNRIECPGKILQKEIPGCHLGKGHARGCCGSTLCPVSMSCCPAPGASQDHTWVHHKKCVPSDGPTCNAGGGLRFHDRS